MQLDTLKNNIVCERCKQSFICNPTNIAECGCSKIELSAQEITYISKKYSDCICNSCLLLLRDEFLSQ